MVGLITDIPFRGEHCPLFSAFWPVTSSSKDFCLPQKEALMIKVEGDFYLLEVYEYKHENLEGMLTTWPFNRRIIADFVSEPMTSIAMYELLTCVQCLNFFPVEQTSNSVRKWLAYNSCATIAQMGISSLSRWYYNMKGPIVGKTSSPVTTWIVPSATMKWPAVGICPGRFEIDFPLS